MFDIHQLAKFPQEPGVYLMKNKEDQVLYVGKAKNLRQRVRQYFTHQDTRAMIPHLVADVERVDIIVVGSEKEALLLENTLIKEHQPKYNVLLKDDKAFISIQVNTQHPWPMTKMVRYKGRPKKGGLHFGPYSNTQAARQTLDLLNRIFPLRECSDKELQNRTRPCILYDMHRCAAPCVGKVSPEQYKKYVQQTVQFLKGKDQEVLEELKGKMHAASEALEFEKAAALLRSIRHLEKTLERQRVAQAGGGDRDVLALFRQGDEVVLTQMRFRAGKLMSSDSYDFRGTVQEESSILESFILQHYDQGERIPDELLLPVELEEQEVLAEILSSVRTKKVLLTTPQRGDKRSLVNMAAANSQVAFERRRDEQALAQKRLKEMKQLFHLKKVPRRIECYDTSNISGTEPVASMVTFIDGMKESSQYRKYKIRTVEGVDDYGYMEEVLHRRLSRGKEEGELPNLIIVDGGKGHLNLALRVVGKMDLLGEIDVIGLAKEEGRHDRGMTAEQVFLPNRKDPILLKRHSPVLFLLQAIRDEAHRVAITFHRSRRGRSTLKSELDSIPGIGAKKRQALLKHFGSLKRVKEATEEQVAQVAGISRKDARAIASHFSS